MSVIKIEFSADGSEPREVIALSYELNQNVDNIGQVAGEVRGGKVVVTLGTIKGAERFGWAASSDMKKSGEIRFIDRNSQTMKTLKFEDAYCVGYKEDYEAFSGAEIKDSAKETLTLSCRIIDIEGEVHENTWEV